MNLLLFSSFFSFYFSFLTKWSVGLLFFLFFLVVCLSLAVFLMEEQYVHETNASFCIVWPIKLVKWNGIKKKKPVVSVASTNTLSWQRFYSEHKKKNMHLSKFSVLEICLFLYCY